jgi:hypothetical protein
MTAPPPRTRKLTIIAQYPSVKIYERILRVEVYIPAEELQPEPWGYRLHRVDYDNTQNLKKGNISLVCDISSRTAFRLSACQFSYASVSGIG